MTLHHNARGQVSNANGGVGFVHVLTSGARGAKGVDTQIGLIDIDLFHSVRFGHHGHSAGGGMDAPLRLGGRYALYPVRTGFKFKPGVDALAADPANSLSIAAVLAFACTQHFKLPALLLRVFAVHAE